MIKKMLEELLNEGFIRIKSESILITEAGTIWLGKAGDLLITKNKLTSFVYSLFKNTKDEDNYELLLSTFYRIIMKNKVKNLGYFHDIDDFLYYISSDEMEKESKNELWIKFCNFITECEEEKGIRPELAKEIYRHFLRSSFR